MTLFLKAKNGQISYLRNTVFEESLKKDPPPLTTVSRVFQFYKTNAFFATDVSDYHR